jgi:2-polyprenyl-6-methoxyphenol hydroxylase-like FAD-dependent oxidoreductase
MPSNRIVLDVRYDALGPHTTALAVHRAALFGVLYREIEREQIPVKRNTKIARARTCADGVELFAMDHATLGTYDFIVDALGANSALAPPTKRTVLPFGALWVNVPWRSVSWMTPRALEQRYRGAHQMAGLLPLGRTSENDASVAAFFWSLRRDRLATWKSEGIDSWKRAVEQLWPQMGAVLDSAIERERIVFAQYDHFTHRVPYSERVVHIGDAAHATSPQLGQGANMALLDAFALSKALETSTSHQAAFRLYARMRHWHVRLFQGASAMFTPFYQSDSRVLPVIRDWFAAPLSRLPVGRTVLARLVSGMTISPIRGHAFNAVELKRVESGTRLLAQD